MRSFHPQYDSPKVVLEKHISVKAAAVYNRTSAFCKQGCGPAQPDRPWSCLPAGCKRRTGIGQIKEVRGRLFLDENVFLALFFGHILFHKKPFPGEWVHLCVVHQARIGGWGWGKDLDLFWVDLEMATGKRF
jgi:hypothetical protein